MENPFSLEEKPRPEEKQQPEPKPEPKPETEPKPQAAPEPIHPPAPPAEPTPIASSDPREFLRYFDAQIEQAHEPLGIFQGTPGTPRPDATAPPEQTAETGSDEGSRGMWKYLVIAAGALAALALAAPFIRKLFGGQSDDSGWYRRSEPKYIPPSEGAGGAAQVPESDNENKQPEVRRIQDLAAMALGKW